MPAPVLLGALVPALVGTVLLRLGATMERSARSWTRTTGRVVPNEPGTVLPGRFPSFAWLDAAGVEHRRTARTAGGGFPPRIGSLVPVVYDPADPTRARLDTFGQSGRVYLVVGWVVLGIAVLAEAVLLAVYVSLR